jgi:hypothetical protein
MAWTWLLSVSERLRKLQEGVWGESQMGDFPADHSLFGRKKE